MLFKFDDVLIDQSAYKVELPTFVVSLCIDHYTNIISKGAKPIKSILLIKTILPVFDPKSVNPALSGS